MRQIYKNASQVVIYLGEETPGTIEALYLVNRLNQMAKSHSNAEIFESVRHDKIAYLSGYFQDFFERSWFSRLWVLQEVVMSVTVPAVICGESVIPWSDIERATILFYDTGLVLATDRLTVDKSYHAILMAICHEFTGQLDMLDLLQRSSDFQATDPRDRLFALYGLAADMQSPEAKEQFPIDYSISTNELYREFTRSYIAYTKSANLLVNATESNNIESLPTWAPDWSKGLRSSFLGGPVAATRWKASGTSSVRMLRSRNLQTLRIGAILTDSVTWVSNTYEYSDLTLLPQLRRPGYLFRIWQAVSTHLAGHVNPSDLQDTFWRTLIANTTSDILVPDDTYQIHFLCFWCNERIADRQAEYYVEKNGPGQISIDEQTRVALTHEQCLVEHCDEEHVASLDRIMSSKYARSHCATKRTECTEKSCVICDLRKRDPIDCLGAFKLSQPGGRAHGFELEKDDEFVREHFRRLRNDVLEPGPIVAGKADNYADALSRALFERRVFITESGKLGLGPVTTEIGDKVAVISGASMPFVLREAETSPAQDMSTSDSEGASNPKHYNLIGPAYVHGIMNGEALQHATTHDGAEIKPDEYPWPYIDLV
ncbi:hypothetical protein BT63DRAFT_423356 [Microthyrium microscopicum]|uniref:Heterokaryon incompatibility domain-containing protein n=1 Tax=Microthyrium microscopicum TaxID=703497 RepID=A0A6A6UI39_9PEZI|nr:hypothetical protein BT63DRAFT_423356 [Microthyrium microscopicum]